MPVDPNRRKVLAAYLSDDGLPYSVVTTLNHANAAGMAGPGNAPPLPRTYRPRVVYGLSTDLTGPDQKAKLVIPDPGHPLWTGAANGFTINGLGDFIVTGRSGEKRSRGAIPLP